MKKYFKSLGAVFFVLFTLLSCTPSQPIPDTNEAIADEPIAIESQIVEPILENSLKELFFVKYNVPVSEITIKISAQDEAHVKGGVSFAPSGTGDGGLFLAVKVNDKWKLIYNGNGSVSCPEIRKYGFTQDLLEGVCDPIATKEPTAVKVPAVVNETMIVKVYFNNPDNDPNWAFECSNVFAVEREILQTKGIALATVKELLKGPTAAEKDSGYITNINSGVKIQSLTVKNGVAKIDFNEQLQYQVGGSCKISAIIAQIKETLKQFSTVNDVVISINGETEAILQP